MDSRLGRGDARKCVRGPGRPRDAELEDRILAETLRQLAAEGYARMSLESVAAAAGVGKPTIYRRWSGKADLATAALRTLQLAEPPVDRSSTVAELKGILANFRASLLRPNGIALVGTVLAEEQHTPGLLKLFRERLVEPRRKMLLDALERSRAAGELRADAPLDVAVNMLVGAFYARYLAASRIPADWPGRLAETVWRGLARAAERGA